MIKTLLALTVAVSLFAKAGQDVNYRKTVQSPQPVSFWLLAEKPVPLVKQYLQTVQPVALKARELLIKDSDSGLFVVQNPAEGKIKYSLYLPSGALLSQFSSRWDSDLPLPQILIDSQRERIISLDQSGRLGLRDFSGELLWKKDLNVAPVFTYENTYAAALNTESGVITAVISQPSKEDDPRWQTRVFKVSPQREILKERIFSNTKMLKMDMKADGSRSALMLISTEKRSSERRQIRTLILDETLQVLRETHFQYRKAVFADKDHILFMGKRKVRFMAIKSGRVLWELSEAERIFDSVVLSKNNFAGLISGRAEYIDGKLFYRDTHFYQTDCFKYEIQKTVIPDAEFIPGNIRQTAKGQWNLGGRKGVYIVPELAGGK